MILLAGFFESIGIIILTILCMTLIGMVLGIFLKGASNFTGKTFVHRGRVVMEPDKPYQPKPWDLPPQRKEVEVIPEVKSVSLSKNWKYENSTDLTQIAANSRTEMVNKERSQFESKLLESGVSKETATKMALERFPKPSNIRMFGQSQ